MAGFGLVWSPLANCSSTDLAGTSGRGSRLRCGAYASELPGWKAHSVSLAVRDDTVAVLVNAPPP